MTYSEVVCQFRNKINKDQDFIILKYANTAKKNHWNCICSAMDWLTVATGYLDNRNIVTSHIDEISIQAYLYISVVDIVWEAIKQLHRVIIDKDNIPFTNQNHIFNDTRLAKDDNEYFKHIRAAFGAHPVNLNDDGKRFASWPTNHVYTEYNLAVILYSSDKNKEDIVLGIKFKQLTCFLKERLSYLKTILKQLGIQKKQYLKSMRDIPIEKHEDTLKLLKILQIEAKKRFNNDYYKEIISKLIIFYETEITEKKNAEDIKVFKKELSKIVTEINNNLQKMSCKELKTDFTSVTKTWCPEEVQYSYVKISEQVNSEYTIPFCGGDKVLSFMSNYVTINDNMSFEELDLLANVSFFIYHKKKQD